MPNQLVPFRSLNYRNLYATGGRQFGRTLTIPPDTQPDNLRSVLRGDARFSVNFFGQAASVWQLR